MTVDAVLGSACLVAAVGGIAVYLWMVIRRPQLIRLLTGLGLFLTGLALFQGPAILAAAPSLHVRLALVALILAVLMQALALLRMRPSWSGVERRGPPAP